MAVAALAAATSNSTNNAASHTGTAGTPNAGDLLIVCVLVSGNTVVGSMSGTWTWNFLTSFTKNAGADTVYIFYAEATAGTSTTPVYTISGNSTGSAMSVLRVTGLDSQVQPYIRQWKTATGTTGARTCTMDAAVLTGNGVIGIATNTTNSAAQWTAPASWSEVHEVAYTTPAASLETCYRASGETGTAMAWTNANTTAWGLFVMELWVAGSGRSDATSEYNSSGMFGV